MTVSRIKAFPKIFHLGTRYVESIFDEPVEITEKIDGSQIAWGKIDGQVHIRSKGAEIIPTAPNKMFEAGVDSIMSMNLPNDLVFYGEYLSKPKHNTLTYGRIPKGHIALFGIADKNRERMGGLDIETWAHKLGIEAIPVLHTGLSSPEHAMSLLERESILGNCQIEGVVIKNYKDMMVADRIYPVMAAKYVSEKFKEVHSKKWNRENTGKGKWEAFMDRFCTEARWEKAIQHLAEAGELCHEPKDIGQLIKEIQRDIEEEEADRIKQFLWKEFGWELLRKSVHGFPEYYKRKLAEADGFTKTEADGFTKMDSE